MLHDLNLSSEIMRYTIAIAYERSCIFLLLRVEVEVGHSLLHALRYESHHGACSQPMDLRESCTSKYRPLKLK